MDSMYENPLARMYGPYFLVFYVIVFIFLVYFLRYLAPKIVSRKRTADAPVAIPEYLDPYEIAYLQNGQEGMTHLAIYTLIQRGFMSIMTNSDKSDVWLAKRAKGPSTDLLNDFEKTVLNLFGTKERSVKQVLNYDVFETDIKKACEGALKELESKRMIWTQPELTLYNRIKYGSIAFFILLGIYKAMAATAHGHKNIGILILLGIAGTVILWNFKAARQASSLGKTYMEHLKSVFSKSNNSVILSQPLYMQQLQIAIYGIIVLHETTFYYLSSYLSSNLGSRAGVTWDGSAFTNGSSGSGCSSYSSGCGGGSSCGGGCGGGCGGCS